MDEETQKIIDEQVRNLPADVKQAIISVNYQTKLQEITKRQKLMIDQIAKVEMETTLVMIGLEPLTDYVANLQRELGVSEARAREISLDVNENIFKPIRESLRQMNEAMEKAGEPAEQSGLIGMGEDIKFTNSNETNLNRDQILKEIENPAPNRIPVSAPAIKTNPEKPLSVPSTTIEIRPAQEIEIKPNNIPANIVEAKMTSPIVTKQQITDLKPETKLPEVKKKPSSGVDPYREPIA